MQHGKRSEGFVLDHISNFIREITGEFITLFIVLADYSFNAHFNCGFVVFGLSGNGNKFISFKLYNINSEPASCWILARTVAPKSWEVSSPSLPSARLQMRIF